MPGVNGTISWINRELSPFAAPSIPSVPWIYYRAMVNEQPHESSDDFDQIDLNALSRSGFALGIASMVTLGLSWIIDIPSRVELAALLLLVVAAILVIVGVIVEAARSGLSFPRMLRLFVRVIVGLFASLRAWFLP